MGYKNTTIKGLQWDCIDSTITLLQTAISISSFRVQYLSASSSFCVSVFLYDICNRTISHCHVMSQDLCMSPQYSLHILLTCGDWHLFYCTATKSPPSPRVHRECDIFVEFSVLLFFVVFAQSLIPFETLKFDVIANLSLLILRKNEMRKNKY